MNPRWAVEIKNTALDDRNLSDLLAGLDYRIVPGLDSNAIASPCFEQMSEAQDVWSAAKELREAITGAAAVDPEFEIGSVIDFASNTPKRHAFLEPKSVVFTTKVGTATLTVSPPADLSEEELNAWHAKRVEQEYQAKLESQRKKLEPALREPRAAKVMELLDADQQSGESINKIYELMEGHRSNRKSFQRQFGITSSDFMRFGDAVHNPVVSGDLARHAYREQPKSPNPMNLKEAEAFVRGLATRWLEYIRHNT